MSNKAVSMNRVYDIFAQETRKQARLYGNETTRKTNPRTNKIGNPEPPHGRKRVAKSRAQE